ncbi:hypothetical protein V8C35DRAFT_311892 [Trichoderma chlorosporum]
MANQITEIIIFDTQPSIINEAQSLLANGKWNDVLSTLTQQTGVRTVYWGQTVESPIKVYLLIDWISSQHYARFKQSTAFTAFQTNLDLITSSSARSIYVPIAPLMHPRIFQDGVTEIAIFSSYSSSFIDTFDSFSTVIEASHGCTGIVKDIATSEISQKAGEAGESEQLYVAMIGWLDLGTHEAAMESEGFKKHVPYIEACVKEITVYHVNMVMV